MTASLQRLRPGPEAAAYYLTQAQDEARPDRREAYYQAEGSGVWWSSGGSVVRHGAAIIGASFRDLCAGLDPGTGRPLVRGAGAGHHAGTDCTMTAGKSVSVLWAAGDADQRALIEQAHRAAVDAALGFVEREGLIEVRTGAGGREHRRPADLIAATFDHYTTREGDPNLHTHCVLLNVAGNPGESSGRYKSLRHLTTDPARLFEQQRGVGAAYRAALAEQLHAQFGWHFRPAGNGQWEVAGVDERVLEAFSKRSAQIRERVGSGATSAQREVAALATRRAKDLLPSGPELEARWQRELAELGTDLWRSAREATRDPELAQQTEPEHDLAFDLPEISGATPVARAASRLLWHENVITRAALLQASLEEASLHGLGIGVVEAELARLEHEGTLVHLSSAALEPSQGACWTTPGIAACEAALLRASERPRERRWISPETIAAALEQAPQLAPEQAEAVRLAAGMDGVSLIEAGAGTGKTTTARVLVEAARIAGLRVVGLAPSWVAADELARSTGIPAKAIARWRYDQSGGPAAAASRGAALGADTLVLIDEAGMVGTRDLEAVLSAAHAAGAKVVLLGDRRQLASVAGASALRAVAEVCGRQAVLGQVRRQQVPWQRAASELMAQGETEAGLRAYAGRGCVELVSGAEAAQVRVIALWREMRARHGEDVLIVTRRNRDAAALNRLAREVLRAEGRLGPDLVEVSALDREDRRVVLPLAVGDRLRFGETLPELGVRNGNRAEVRGVMVAADGQVRLRLKLEDGRILEEVWEQLARAPRFGSRRPPRITPALAGTAHAAQGRTSAAAVLYVGSSADARETYVGLTRHRQEAQVVVERDRLDALCRQRQADARLAPTESMLLERLFAEAGRYREKANVSDYVADRLAFVRTGVIDLREPEIGLRVGRAIAAAKALAHALRRIDLMPWRGELFPRLLAWRHHPQRVQPELERAPTNPAFAREARARDVSPER
ncbi:MobF family relaxase [Methylobacterium nonmethylotrophicum]|uniref:Conjugal transfer protein n=2 Tax=Pseudomonadota TaxID=1224 RepID=A0A4Z0NI61_9HYPH|nr:MobF family relaxase [Methylobacterium nonmethylotrophicum]TGD95168.1 conjugal transfer protein [Methylobacterium nonmethylotrophicum]